MDSFVNHIIIPELNLWLETYSGIIDVDTIIRQRMKVIADKNYIPEYNAICDFRDSVLSLRENDVKKFIEVLKSDIRMQGNRVVGILTNTPNQVAVTTLYALNLSGLPMKIEIFSTIEAASRFIGHGNKSKYIEDILHRLKMNIA